MILLCTSSWLQLSSIVSCIVEVIWP